MKISFKNYKSLSSVDTNICITLLTKNYVEKFTKVKGECSCKTDCKCGEKCNCEKCPLQQAIYELDFKGKKSQKAIVSSKMPNFDKMVFVGLGEEKDLTPQKLEEIGFGLFNLLKCGKSKNATIIFNSPLDKNLEIDYTKENIDLYSSLLFGFNAGEYNFDKHFTGEKLKEKECKLKEVVFVAKDIKNLEKKHKENEIIKESVFFCRDLVNEPSNVIYPESYAKIAKGLEKLGLEVEILSKNTMEKLGMNALLAVNQGSAKDPYMVILKWNGGNAKDKPLAFVGKGVTFDSGGLSLKPSSAMGDMKIDMGGSAVVISLLKLLATRKAKVNAIGVMPLVENMPSGTAVKVGDIIKSMSGQTIEIMNTDAEGRVILADALYYTATKFKPELIIDLATLTGAICVALGEKYAGLFTNNTELFQQLKASGENVNENVWRMPLSDLGEFYDNQINSDFADMKNVGDSRDGGSITAAQFLHRFIDKHPKWAHLDIAATAYVTKKIFLTKKNASGYGVRLLNDFVKNNYEK